MLITRSENFKKQKYDEMKDCEDRMKECLDEMKKYSDLAQEASGEMLNAVEAYVAEMEKEYEGLEKERKLFQRAEQLNQYRSMSDSSFRSVVKMPGVNTPPAEETHSTDTVEYRKAFMRFVQRGDTAVLGMQQRADLVTNAESDASAAVPQTVVNEIIKRMKVYGEIWAKVRKTNVKGGVSFPVSTLRPTATWVGEGASDSKKLATKKISFSYYGLECKLAQTLVASVVTLEAFQALFVELAVEAIVQALEQAIVNGTGNEQPVGITKDSRVPSANSITMTAADFTWKGWKSKVFAKMKKAYRDGTFIMAQGTFDGNIDGMVDTNGQPVARVNYGIDGGEKYRFGGKEVLTTEEDILPTYDDAVAGEVFAVFLRLSDYCVNSNMQLKTVKWTDHDTNEVKNKAIVIVDGKLLDASGVLLIKKGA